MPITIDGNGTITGASTLATTVANPTFTTPNINSAQFATVSGTAPIYPCRAWVNFNGTGTVAIRASGNVSSITDLGVGSYQINFSAALSDGNGSYQLSAGNAPVDVTYGIADTNPSWVRVYTYRPTTGVSIDMPIICVSVFR